MPRLPAGACLAIAAALAGPACADTYRLDPVHTRVAFIVGHAGLSQAIGTFSGVSGRLEFDPAHWGDARVELALPVASLDLGDADWNRRVLDGTFLDAGDFPHAHFVSTAVEPVDDGHARITGTLTLRGVARPVVLDARLNAVKRHPVTRRRSAGFSATATVSRRDFGIDAWPNVIDDQVRLLIEVEAIRDDDAPAPDAPTAPTEAPDAADP